MKKYLYITLLSYTICCFSNDSISLDLAATVEEQDMLGFSDFSDEKRKELEQWLAKWTHKVLEASKTYHPALSLNEWINQWPMYLQASTTNNTPAVIAQKEQVQNTLLRNINGERIILTNGSEWEILPGDRYIATLWLRDTPIEIKERKGTMSFSYTLINTTNNTQVYAKKIKDPSPQRIEASGYFKGTFQLHVLNSTGNEIRLMNNSSWKIAPLDHKKVATTWKLHDRIRIENSNDTLYPYVLNNLDSGSSALAMKKE